MGLATLALGAGLGCSSTVIREDDPAGDGAVGDEIEACIDDLGELEAMPSGDCKRYCAAYSCAECESTVAECEALCSEHVDAHADDPDALACLACAAADVESVVDVFTCEDFSTSVGAAMRITWRSSACPVCEL